MNYTRFKMGLQNIKIKIAKKIYISLTKWFYKNDESFLKSISSDIYWNNVSRNFSIKQWSKIDKINIY